jgi:hypothetical protein
MRRIAILLGLALSLCAGSSHAQGAPSVKPNERTSWYRIIYVKFKPGALEEAQKLIYDHFWPIDKEIGREVIPFDAISGEWDQIVGFPMDGTPTQLAVADTPMDRKWNEALARREGGKAQAEAIWKRYMELVMTTKSEIALRHMP